MTNFRVAETGERNVGIGDRWCAAATKWVGGRFQVRVLERTGGQSFNAETIVAAARSASEKAPGGSSGNIAWFLESYLPGAGLAEKLSQQADDKVRVLWSRADDAAIAVYLPSASGRQEIIESTACGEVATDTDTPVEIVPVGENQIFPQGSVESSWLFEPQDSWWIPREELDDIVAIRIDWDQLSPSQRELPLDYVASDNSPLGVLARSILPRHTATLPAAEPARNMLAPADIDVVAVTTDRFSSVRELLRSIRAHLSTDLRITVVVQSANTWRWKRLSSKYDARFVHVAHDLGLSQSRNVAIDATDRPIVFLMDDDFQVDSRCRLDDALAIMNAQPDIAVLGGNLLDVTHWSDGVEKERSQGFAMNLIQTAPDIRWLRLEDSPRKRRYSNATDYVEDASIVDNFALIRRKDVFDRGIRWNPELKIGAEHQDLYLSIVKKGGVRIARTNALKVRNVRVQSPRFRRMRARTDFFFSSFFARQQLSSFEIVGERMRVVVEDGGHAYQQRHDTAPHYVSGKGAVGANH